jgi:hypothetical protein
MRSLRPTAPGAARAGVRMLAALSAALLLLIAVPASATTWYVDWSGGGDFFTIAEGLGAAADGDTVIVASGTYADYAMAMPSGVALLSETGDPADAVIDAGYYGQIMYCIDADDNTVIRGFTFSHGFAYGSDGAALSMTGSYVTVEDCVFYQSETYFASGGAVSVSGGNPAFLGCRFEANVSDDFGGGMYVNDSSPTITHCSFLNNSALTLGGGLHLRAGSSPTISFTVFAGNYADDGGGIYCETGSDPTVESCTFYDNGATSTGSAVACYVESWLDMTQSIVAQNTGSEPIYCDESPGAGALLGCCDVWGNAAGDYVACIEGQDGVNGNFSLDPMFCNAEGGELQLHEGSPCADAPGCGTVGALGVGCVPRIWYVPDDAPTIAAAIDSAFAGDTIIVRSGTYIEGGLNMKDGVVLEGETGDPDDVVIDAGSDARVFFCSGLSSDTEIRGLTIANGSSYYEPGGGMYVTDSYLTVEDCVFFLNETHSADGGGVAISGGEPTFIGCSFLSNSSDYSAGGMLVASSSPTIAECWFGNNSAVSYGGGLYLEWSSPIVDHCVFASNQSFEGGAIGCMGSSPQIEFCTFYDNDVDSYGGALVCYEGSNPTLTNTIIAEHGGGEPVVCDGSRSGATLSCCDVWGNAGGDYSGCLAGQGGVNGNFSADPLFCIEGESVSFEVSACSPCADAPGCGQVGALGVGCGGRIWVVPDDAPTIAAAIDSAAVCDTVLILEGTYYEHGINLKSYVTVMGDPEATQVIVDGGNLGAVFHAFSQDHVVLKNLTITNGIHVEWGGGLWASYSYVDVYNVTFDSNNGTWGGAVSCYGDSAHFTDCAFTSNTGDVGGAVFYDHWGSLRMTRCEFIGNDSPNNGGGLAATNGDCTLIDCSFVGNTADSGGGIMYGADEVRLRLQGCTFSGNHARFVGGGGGGLYAVWLGQSPPEIRMAECVFFENTTDGSGGGACFEEVSATLTSCTFHGNAALVAGDGIEVRGTGATLSMDHTIVSGGPSGVGVSCTGPNVTSVICSDVYGNAGGDWVGCLAPFAPPSYGNFSLDPMYCDPGSGDLHLDMNSPCADAPGCGQVGALGVGCGIIWYVPDDAPTIAAGIDSAGPGDTVIVRSGTYYEHDISMKSGIYLRSETLDPADVVINAVGGDQRGLSCVDVDSTTVIQGLTIAGGDAPAGGGMAISNASPRVLDCIIRNNTATAEGGGVLCVDSSPRFERCRFESNSADSGGAFNCSLGSPSFLECVFAGNMTFYGGGGGAVSCGDGAEPTFTGCVFDDNSAYGGEGSAFYCASDMRAPATVTVDNTIIAFGDVAPAYCAGTATVTLTCCDVYGNAGGDYVGCIAGQEGVNGNISDDPLFCGGDNPDNPYALKSTSPCAAENNPGCGQIGPYGIGCAGYIDWDAGGDGETWEDPDNWDPDKVPGEGDHARILLDGTYSVYYNSVSDIWALTHGAASGTQTLDIQTGSLAVTHGAVNTREIVVREGSTFDASVGRDSSVVVNEPDATFTLDGGDLIGTGIFINRGLFNKIGSATSHLAIMFENQEYARGGLGTMEAEAGTLSVEGETSTDGRLNVNSGATAIVSEHFVRGERQSTGSLTNRGLVTVAPDGRLGADATLAIANEDGGVVALNDGDLIGSGRFVNLGLVEKIGSGTSHVLLTFENLVEERGGLGTVGAEAGTLSLEGETNSDGRLNVNSGATAIVSEHFIRKERKSRQDAAFDNTGDVVVAPGGRFVVDATGSVWSSGTFDTRGRIAVAPGASFASEGNVVVRYGGALYAAGDVFNEAGGNLINNGLTHVPDGGMFTNNGYFDHRENGLLKGSGTVDNTEGVAAIKGLVAPGDSHGTLTYLGNFIQAPTSEISFEIGGYDQGVNYDLLDITGVSVFKGAIDLSFTGGFVPVLNDSFQVIAHGEAGGRERIDFDCFAGLGVSDTLYMQPIQRFGKLLFRAIGGSTGNAPPVGADDAASVTGYEPITIDVLANDTDADLDPLRVIILNLDLTEGVAYINEADSLVTYAAVPGFAGADSFDYVVTDCLGGSDTARVRIDVTAPPATWYVPEDSGTIAGALALTSPGDTVVVACGTYYESDIVVPPGVTLVSETGDPDCVIIDASGRAGRGLFFADLDSTTVVAGISVTGAISDGLGGGMFCQSASPKIIDCRFFDNSALGGGGAAVTDLSSPSFEGCAFDLNTAESGGGMICLGGSTPDIDECVFAKNGAPSGGGGALAADEQAIPKLKSCTLSENHALAGGGLFLTGGAFASVDRTIVVFSVESEAVVCELGGLAELSCSDVYANDGGDWTGCIAEQAEVNGNFSHDPAFCDLEAGDYHVLPDSPCADAMGCGLVGALEAGCLADPEIHVDPASFAFEVGAGGTTSDVLEISDLGRSNLYWLIRENGPVPEVTDPKPAVKAKVLPRELATVLEPMRPTIPHVEVEKGESDSRGGRGPTRGAGGPDAFGHTWIDNDEPFGPTYDWREISGLGTALALSDDSSKLVALPFAFPFYASQKTSVRISSNGYLTFGAVGADYSNDPIPDAWVPNDLVAPFWDDLNPTLGGAVYYYHDAAREEFIVQYDGVYDYYGVGPYTFEVVLKPSGSILFLYDEIAGEPHQATVGIENATGTEGLEIAFNAPYVHDRLAVLIEDPAPWLTEDPPSGVTAGLGDVSVTLEVDTEGLMPGLHLVTLVVLSNDPDEPEVMIPVSLLIGGTDVEDGLPTRYVLHGNYPNPFNPRTEIRYDLPAPATVNLRVYSIAGRLVRELLEGERQDPGRYAIPWNGRDDSGERVASGVYYYKLEADGEALTNRMVLLK